VCQRNGGDGSIGTRSFIRLLGCSVVAVLAKPLGLASRQRRLSLVNYVVSINFQVRDSSRTITSILQPVTANDEDEGF
jgi:hypothetical protein